MRLSTILLLLSFSAILLSQIVLAESNEPLPTGRYLPNGTWQARNTRAAQPEPWQPEDNPFDIFTQWGMDIRLSYTGGWVHDPEIAAWGNYVYVTWWHWGDYQIDLARSTDLGTTWQPQLRISDTLDNYTGIPQIAADDSCAYVVYTVGASWIWLARSTDYGQSWTRRNIYRTGRYEGGAVLSRSGTASFIASFISKLTTCRRKMRTYSCMVATITGRPGRTLSLSRTPPSPASSRS